MEKVIQVVARERERERREKTKKKRKQKEVKSETFMVWAIKTNGSQQFKLFMAVHHESFNP